MDFEKDSISWYRIGLYILMVAAYFSADYIRVLRAAAHFSANYFWRGDAAPAVSGLGLRCVGWPALFSALIARLVVCVCVCWEWGRE